MEIISHRLVAHWTLKFRDKKRNKTFFKVFFRNFLRRIRNITIFLIIMEKSREICRQAFFQQ